MKWNEIRAKRRKKIRKKRRVALAIKISKTLASTTKQLIWIFSINGILWIWCSYLLAFLGRDQIAEALSTNVCSIVIGQMGFYLVTKTVENLSKFNPILNGSVSIKNNKSEDTPEPEVEEPEPEDE